MDKDTLDRLKQGERIVEILKQPQYKPLTVEKEVIVLYAVTKKYLSDVNVEKSLDFETELLSYVESRHPEILNEIKTTGDLGGDLEERLKNVIENFKKEIKI